MQTILKLAIAGLVCMLVSVSMSVAQTTATVGTTVGTSGINAPVYTATTPQGLMSQAIGFGDTVTIAALLSQNQNNPTVLAQLANSLLASAQATQAAGNSAGGAILAAFAFSSGGLTGANLTAALNLASSNPAAQALLGNPNAPATGSSFLSNTLASSGPIVVAANPAGNPSQSVPGSPS